MKNKIFKKGAMFAVMAAFSLTAVAESSKIFESPESVLYDGKNLYISNVGTKLDPSAEDGDGYISLADTDGAVKEKKYFSEILNAPKGMVIYKDVLYVTDINRVVGLDTNTRKKNFEISFKEKGVNFLNDIAVDKDGILYVSATDTGDVYQVNLETGAVSRLLIDKLPGPNGLAYDEEGHSLWVASFGSGESKKGELGKIDIATRHYEKVKNLNGMFDGIAIKNPDTIFVTDWVAFDNSGKLLEVNVVTGEYKVILENIGGPADFAYVKNSGLIYMPRMIESSVSILDLK